MRVSAADGGGSSGSSSRGHHKSKNIRATVTKRSAPPFLWRNVTRGHDMLARKEMRDARRVAVVAAAVL